LPIATPPITTASANCGRRNAVLSAASDTSRELAVAQLFPQVMLRLCRFLADAGSFFQPQIVSLRQRIAERELVGHSIWPCDGAVRASNAATTKPLLSYDETCVRALRNGKFFFQLSCATERLRQTDTQRKEQTAGRHRKTAVTSQGFIDSVTAGCRAHSVQGRVRGARTRDEMFRSCDRSYTALGGVAEVTRCGRFCRETTARSPATDLDFNFHRARWPLECPAIPPDGIRAYHIFIISS